MTTTTSPRPLLARPTDGHDDDVAAIRAVVADVEAGFNGNDVDRATAHFAADAVSVGVTGAELVGIDAIVAAHRSLFAGVLADQHARYEVVDVAFVRPDVALARKHAWATDAEGTDLDVGHAMVALYVMVREEGRWWIAARQNTLAPT